MRIQVAHDDEPNGGRMMRVTITGATGTIGAALARALRERGDQVVALSRDAERARRALGGDVEVSVWSDPTSAPPPAAALRGADAVVHLLGEPIDQRWTPEAKRRIADSRVLGTRSLVAGLRALEAEQRPRVLVSQSAVGYYGPRRDDTRLTEDAGPGTGFLADVVVGWEREAEAAAGMMRVARTRTGVVLSGRGGALARMLPFFKLGLGGPVAGGRQYVPWIHLDDVVRGLVHCVDDGRANGPLNLTAPAPVTNAELSRALGRALGRPAVLPVPGPALRLLYGEMAELVCAGQRAVPARLEELDFEFAHPELEAALRDVVG
ncbi:MAG TPA: TIGR01777 family oxidoreductase [Solirubrobacteraceae bacterium]|nr:TIGR01777 family oxidoreductase [Solirubrobacteraceae bacterium]